MRKTILKPLAAIACMALFLMLNACQDKDLYTPDPDPDPNDNDPSLLDYSTTRSVKLNLDYDVPTGYAAPFSVYAEPPYEITDGNVTLKEGLHAIAGGIAISGKSSITKDIPAYAEKIYLYSADLFTPTYMEATVEGNTATFSVVDFQPLLPAEPDTRTVYNGKIDLYLGSKRTSPDVDNKHRPRYIDESKTTEVSANLLKKINAAFPDGQKPEENYAGNSSMYLKEAGEVWVSLLVSNCWDDNTLSYFCYDGPKEDLANLTDNQKRNLREVVAFPLAKLNSYDPSLTLKHGEYVQLMYCNNKGELSKVFPKGTTIGWILRAKGYNKNRQSVSNDATRFFSIPEWNPERKPENKNHTIIFNAGTKTDPYICFGFEDTNNESGSDGDCNDVMFHVMSNPIKAIDPPIEIPEPEEPTYAYDESFGILAYEDNWPLKGDYDMNDVVMKYNSVVTLYTAAGETDVYATEINDVFSLIHTGADYENKFGVKINMNPGLVESVSVNGNDVQTTTDGSGFIIDLFNNARDEITPYQQNNSKDFTISIKLKAPGILHKNFTYYAPYNPFISPVNPNQQDRGVVEVHLPKYEPTARADKSFFGTGHDQSIPSQGLYYVSGKDNLYPFAIHLSGVDKFMPEERKSIDVTYPKFTGWVESNQTENTDWYIK